MKKIISALVVLGMLAGTGLSAYPCNRSHRQCAMQSDTNPRGETRPRDGRGQGQGRYDGRRAGRHSGDCQNPDKGPGHGRGQGRGQGQYRS